MRTSPVLALLLAAVVLATVAPDAGAPARAPGFAAPARGGLEIAALAARGCATRIATGPGVVRRRIVPRADGVLSARLTGPAGGDWDLGLVDVRGGHVLAGSAGAGAAEYAEARVRAGRPVAAQVCRRAGAGTRGRLALRVAPVALPTVRAPAATRPDPRAAGRLPSGRTRYRTLPELQEEMKALAAANPDLVRTFALPLRSTEGRQIMGVEIAERVGAPPDGRPSLALLGTFHAREWPADEAAMEWAYELVRGYRRGDPRLSAVVRAERTYVVPVVNVDGFDVTTAAAGLRPDGSRGRAVRSSAATGSGALKRKTCSVPARDPARALPCLARAGGPDRGVDINRNFGPLWGGAGSATRPRRLDYAGPAPFSEPETEAVRRWLREVDPAIVLALHTYSRLVIRPPGRPGLLDPREGTVLRRLGNAMAAAAGYRSIRAFQLYPVSGAVDDYARVALGSLPFTLEIGRAGFHPRYAVGVVREYAGRRGARGGLREAFTRAAEAAVAPATDAVIRGTAPAGRVLRLDGRVAYRTGAGRRTLRERSTAALVVPAGGRFAWAVTPTAGPGAPSGRWTLTCTDALGQALERRPVSVARGAAVDLALACPAAPAGGVALARGTSSVPAP